MPVELSLTHTESGQSVTLSFDSAKAMAAIEKATKDVFAVVEEDATVSEQATALMQFWTQTTMGRIRRYETAQRQEQLVTDIEAEFGFDETTP